MASSDDSTLIKIAVFGVTVSLISTILIGLLLVDDSDYDLDSINGYRDELNQFTGESMISQTPWVLTNVYTPWNNTYATDDVADHLDKDGWLFGQGWNATSADIPASIAPFLGKAANIRMDPMQKSSVPIAQSDDVIPYTFVNGQKWWASGTHWWDKVEYAIGTFFGQDPNVYATGTASIWDFTGYRYVFDPTLPFAVEDNNKTSSRDGSLSVVWYNFNGQEGLSGGLDIYGGDVLLSSISAVDIISNYNTASGYATQYDFNFNGAVLNLSIRFDQSVIDSGITLMQAWTQGAWSMAISSVSAGNFYDVNNSTSFVTTAGSMIDTFIDVFTFNVPSINNPLMDLVLWLIVGLPMMIALMCVTLRIVSSIRVI